MNAIITPNRVLSGPVGQQVWHLITGSHLCVVPLPQVAMLRTYPNVTLAIERGAKPQF